MKLQIVHAVTRYRPALGGVEQYVGELSRHGAAAGHTIRVHTTDLLTWGEGVRPERLPANTPSHETGPPEVFRHRVRSFGANTYAMAPGLATALFCEDADVFHAHYYGHFAADAAVLAARLKRRGLVVNPYMAFSDIRSPLARLHSCGPGWLFRAADRVITLSAVEEAGLTRLGFDRARMARVTPGVDLEELERPLPRPHFFPRQGPVLLFVGRIAAGKGIRTLLESAPLIRHAVPEATFLLVGPDFGLGDEVRRIAAQPDMAGAIRWTGPVSRRDLIAAFQHADLFLFPSRFEAFGIALAEAMATGLVPVAADSMAIPEVVGAAGVLVPPGDAASLAREAVALLVDPSRRRELAEACRSRVRHRFSWKTSAAVLHSIYEDVHRRKACRTIVAFGFARRAKTGGERFYREILDGAAARGVPVREIDQDSISVWGRRRFASALWLLPRLARHAGALLIVDLSWSLRLAFLLKAARLLFRQRLVVGVCHRPSSGESHSLRRRLLALTETIVLSAAHHVLVISSATAREVEAAGVPRERILILPPALSPAPQRRVAPRHPGPFRMVTVGAVIPRKGLGDLLTALSLLSFEWELDVVGSLSADPEEVARLRRRVRELGFERRVRFRDHASASLKLFLLRAADLYVHPSRWEGFGYAVAEAMQFGLPVVATCAGALPELVRPGVTGLLVPSGSPAKLAAAILRLAGDPEGATAMGRAGQQALARWPDHRETAEIFAMALSRWSQKSPLPAVGTRASGAWAMDGLPSEPSAVDVAEQA